MSEQDPITGRPQQFLVGQGKLEVIPLPAQVLTKALATDPSSPEALLRLVSAYGPLGASRQDLIGDISAVRGRRQVISDKEPLTALSEDVADAAAAVAAIQALVLLTRHFQEDPGVARTMLRGDWPELCPWPVPASRTAAERLLADELSKGLLDVSFGVKLRTDPRGLVGTARFRYSLYALCVVELIDHIESQLVFKACRLESCGELFSKHDRPTSSGTHRSSAVYCSHSCAVNQAQRQKRLRDRQRRLERHA
ncbi:MAG: hypothetical protein M3P11_04230 [Actinomycetota bacterium]|nr:hypothetical protein [Actinomycetota bacterium]